MPSSPISQRQRAAQKIWDKAVKENLAKASKTFNTNSRPPAGGPNAHGDLAATPRSRTASRVKRHAVDLLNSTKKKNLARAANALQPHSRGGGNTKRAR